MRWFKHLANASDDEKLSELIDRHGAEGYGIYWMILEKISSKMEKGENRTNCRYPAKKWADICGKNPRGMRKIYETLEYLSLFIFIRYGKHMDTIPNSYQYELDNNCISYEYHIDIDCPNLLKFRDEYSKKSRQTTNNIPIDSRQTPDQDRDTETESETNTETEEKDLPQNEFAGDEPEFYLTKKKRKLTGKRLETFLKFWEIFDYKKDKANAADSWIDIPELTNQLVDEICEAAKTESDNRPELINKGSTPMFAQGWLTARRWEDEQNIENETNETTFYQEVSDILG